MPAVTLGIESDGLALPVVAGDEIIIRLPESPTTGVRWDLWQPEGPVELIDDRYEQPSSGGIGASAVRVFTFHALRPGKAKLNLKRWQSWEGEASVDATFSVVLEILEGPR
ncbi:MAG: protease inhibitor I42 family protein [Candidatus Thiodiazotropha sp.]|jgi:inhibitor of cysteine peptidase